MVLAKEQEGKIRGATAEEFIWHKVNYLQEARETGDGEIYDEVLNSVEKLFRAFPKAHQEMLAMKQQLDAVYYREKENIIREADRSRDVINRENYISEQSNDLDWEYRNLYEEAIIDLMQKHNLIPMSRPHYTDMQSSGESKMESQPSQPPQQTPPQPQPHVPQPMQPQQPQQPQPQYQEEKVEPKPKKKPKLSIRRKK